MLCEWELHSPAYEYRLQNKLYDTINKIEVLFMF